MQDNQKNLEVDNTIQLMTFFIADQEYAINVMSIREIMGWTPVTSLPNTPEYVLGVINLRGNVVPILDLKHRFGRGHNQPTKNHVVMIVIVKDRTMGILVDGVSDIITIKDSEIRALPNLDQNNEKDSLLAGLVNHNKKLNAILNIEKVFDEQFEIDENQLNHIPENNQTVEVTEDLVGESLNG